jgi:DNA modification methylase
MLAKVEKSVLVAGIEALKPYRYFYKIVKDADVGTGTGTFKLGVGRFQECKIKDETVDLIITDPPYPKEFLPEWSDLATFAARVLKPGGSLLAMSGQTYLPEVIRRLGEAMTYQWTLAYLTPGAQSAQVFPRKVNPFWKPVLWYVKGEYQGDWIGDVIKSPTNQNEKDSHDWQQSFGGMTDLVKRFLRRDQVLCDPFCGSGTTGVAALVLNLDVTFIGIEKDAEKMAVAEGRLSRARG